MQKCLKSVQSTSSISSNVPKLGKTDFNKMYQRMEMQEQEKKLKIQGHKEALMDKDIEGCTFQPQVNADKRANQRSREGIRTMGEFQQD